MAKKNPKSVNEDDSVHGSRHHQESRGYSCAPGASPREAHNAGSARKLTELHLGCSGCFSPSWSDLEAATARSVAALPAQQSGRTRARYVADLHQLERVDVISYVMMLGI